MEPTTKSSGTSARPNPKITEFYNRIKGNGKQSTVSQVAVMRRIVIIAHSIYKNNQNILIDFIVI